MFKDDFYVNRKYEVEFYGSFSWLKGENTYSHHMGSEQQSILKDDLTVLVNSCKDLNIKLPNSFIFLMENPRLHKHFRSINDGFFDLSKPIKCPVGDGYLINIITDSQYCHFTYLYLEENSHAYSIVWADDLYDGAIRAGIEEFENEYKDEFDKSEIYLLDNSFEHYMYHYYQLNEEYFSSNKDVYNEPRKSYSSISNQSFNKDESNRIHPSNIDMNSYNGVMDMSDNNAKFLHLIKFSILSFTSIVGVFVSIYTYYMQSVNFSIDGEVVSIEWPIDHQGSPIINIRDHDGKEHEFPSYRVSLTPKQVKLNYRRQSRRLI